MEAPGHQMNRNFAESRRRGSELIRRPKTYKESEWGSKRLETVNFRVWIMSARSACRMKLNWKVRGRGAALCLSGQPTQFDKVIASGKAVRRSWGAVASNPQAQIAQISTSALYYSLLPNAVCVCGLCVLESWVIHLRCALQRKRGGHLWKRNST